MSTTTDRPHVPPCPYCGFAGHPPIRCPRLAAIEYHPDGTTKRVEFHKPESKSKEKS